MTTQHTPGPWRATRPAGTTYFHITSDTVERVAVASTEEDALLIASAPGLRAAIAERDARLLTAAFEIERLQAEITKIKGESNAAEH